MTSVLSHPARGVALARARPQRFYKEGEHEVQEPREERGVASAAMAVTLAQTVQFHEESGARAETQRMGKCWQRQEERLHRVPEEGRERVQWGQEEWTGRR